jgi:hypothetical protein
MADVKDVETAVCEGDSASGGAFARDGVDELGQGQDGHHRDCIDAWRARFIDRRRRD